MRRANAWFVSWVAIVASVSVAVACADDGVEDEEVLAMLDPEGPADAGRPTQLADAQDVDDAPAAKPGVVAVLNDPQVAGVATSLNQGEIDQGTLARTKAVEPAVVQLAARMVSEHAAANQRLQMLAAQQPDLTPTPSQISQSVKAEGDAVLAELQPLVGAAFDRTYVESQVTTHTKALAMIDTTLLPAVKAEALRAELTAMRGHVEAHLAEAKTLLETLGAGGDDAGTDAGPP